MSDLLGPYRITPKDPERPLMTTSEDNPVETNPEVNLEGQSLENNHKEGLPRRLTLKENY